MFCECINLEYLEKKYFKPSIRGQHPIPLLIPLCIWVFAYLNGELSYRKVAKLCKTDDNYYWLSCGFEPSAPYLEVWRVRMFPLISKMVDKFLNLLKEKELIHNELFGLDGVKIKVWASKSQSKTEKQIYKEVERIEKNVKEAIKPYKKKRIEEIKKEKLKFFKYNKELDCYVCIKGVILYRMSDRLINGKSSQKVYMSKVKDCENCELFPDCQTNKRGVKIITESIEDSKSSAIKRAIEYYNENKELYKRRKVINEPVHGQMFHNMNINKLHCINDDAIDGEIALIILIYMLKKYEAQNLLFTILTL